MRRTKAELQAENTWLWQELYNCRRMLRDEANQNLIKKVLIRNMIEAHKRGILRHKLVGGEA